MRKSRECSSLFSKQRCKQAEKILKKANEAVARAILLRDFLTNGNGLQKIVTDIGNHFRSAKESAAFKLQIKTAEIHICRPDRCDTIIADENF